jgi:hypothetical protein
MFLSKRQISMAEGVGGAQACASPETPRQETDNHQGAKELEGIGSARPIKKALIKTQRVTGKLEPLNEKGVTLHETDISALHRCASSRVRFS